MVFGHSPHVCRGVEVFENGLILYSTGNFVDDYAVNLIEHNDRSWIFELHVENGQIHHLHLHPTMIRRFQARHASHNEAETMRSDMQRRCEPLGTSCIMAQGQNHLIIEVCQQASLPS